MKLAEMEAEPKKRKITPFKLLSISVRTELIKLIKMYARSEISVNELESRFELVLFDGHSRASVIGRNISGDLTPMTGEDRLLASIVLDKDKQYLNKFMNDIREGRYTLEDGVINTIPINQRATMYAAKMRGTMHESFVGASRNGSLFDWILIAEDNCDDCPRIAASSPYTKSTLPTFPGAGQTQCVTNCKCVLMRDDGVVTESYPYETVDELVEAVI